LKPVLTTDQLCWERLRGGSETAFAALMRGQFGLLYNYGSKFSKDTELVKDCIQDMFLDLWHQHQKLPPVSSVKAYLMTSLRNRLLRSLQQQQRVPKDALEEKELFIAEFSIEQQLIDEETVTQTARRISQAMNALSRRQKEAIFLRYYQDIDRSQIAQVMGLSEQSVSNLLHQALTTMRSKWLSAGLVALLWSFLYHFEKIL
jgi:RNA polymerase sigma factor (sigma-70 family)